MFNKIMVGYHWGGKEGNSSGTNNNSNNDNRMRYNNDDTYYNDCHPRNNIHLNDDRDYSNSHSDHSHNNDDIMIILYHIIGLYYGFES